MHLLRDYFIAIVINQNKVFFQMITVTFEKVVVAVVIVEMVKAKNHMMVVVVVTTIK